MAHYRQAFMALHGAVLLFALSGLFAKWLTISPIDIVFGRAFFACIALGCLLVVYQKHDLFTTKSRLFGLFITGAILAFHWVSFFSAIQISSVAIGLLTFAAFPVFVALFEPWFFTEQYKLDTLIQAVITVIGIYLLLPNEAYAKNALLGIYWGLASALSFAILTLLNRKFVAEVKAKQVAFYQNGFAALVLLPFIDLFTVSMNLSQWQLLMLLGVVFTALSHSLFNFSLKRLSGQTASIAVSLEPLYGIIAAYFLLGELVSIQMMVGGGFILFANIWAMYLKR
ncbi:DMT family transporter [Thalassotalea hakodatensis]|uniref:DMT family transporter n=1 Tax=Thalassotalea hakodatensis TaxID=3030492 RepID=UPI0025743F08|nr:DMT family transporter [Thalassotalea hakodatensis]